MRREEERERKIFLGILKVIVLLFVKMEYNIELDWYNKKISRREGKIDVESAPKFVFATIKADSYRIDLKVATQHVCHLETLQVSPRLSYDILICILSTS